MSKAWVAGGIVALTGLGLAARELGADQRGFAITVADGVKGARCLSDSNTIAGPVQVAGSVALLCGNPGAEMRCDFANAEPVDISEGELCKRRRLDPAPAVIVRVRSGQDSVVVRWLDLEDGQKVIATRDLAASVNGTIQVPVHRSENRALRFQRGGNSPVTVAATDLVDQWVLPPPRLGGEIVIRQQPGSIVPDAYALSRIPAPVVSQSNKPLLSVTGLQGGEYSVTPLYSEELRGQTTRVNVQPGRTTFVPLQLESVGAVETLADDNSCAATERLSITQLFETLSATGTRVQARQRMLAVPHDGKCRRLIKGLPEGRYEATLERNETVFSTRSFDIVSQQTARVAFEAAVVVVGGNVTLNGRAAPDMTLVFTPQSSPGTRTTVRVPGGRLSTSLESPGVYKAELSSARFERLGPAKEVSLQPGYNQFDWDIKGGTLIVELSGWDGRGSVEVSIIRRQPSITGAGTTISRTEELPLTVSGLPFAEYRLDARQNVGPGQRRRTSQVVTVALDEDHPERTVKLTLQENDAVLRLQDGQQRPVGGARVSGLRAQVRETAPGSFPLDGVAPGTQLTVAADGFTPTCRTVPANSDMNITLSAGRQIVFDLVGLQSTDSISIGGLLWPGVDCPVQLSFFRLEQVIASGTDSIAFRIHSFPIAQSVTFTRGGLVQQIRLDQNVVRITIGK